MPRILPLLGWSGVAVLGAAAFAVLNAMWYELMEATPHRPALQNPPDRQPLSAEG